MLEIRNHLLVGDNVEIAETGNKGGPVIPRFLVMHYTAGRNAESSVRHFQNPAAGASAHLVIGRNGRIWQLVPFNLKAWHAGISSWAGLDGLNSHSIGIELDNAGRLQKVGDQYQAWFGAKYPESEVICARHKNEQQDSYWHAYAEPQISAALEVSKLLFTQYTLEDILGHEDIAPGRKSDPGPAFRMSSFRSALLGRESDVPPQYRVNVSNLNIRSGPGTEFPALRTPLPFGSVLSLVEMGPHWAKVVVSDATRVEGWVNNSYIVKV